MTAEWYRQAAKDAIERYGAPEIFNTVQVSRFTSAEFTSLLESYKVQISMDGKGRAIDNVFVEKLWRSIKYEHVYLHIYNDAVQLYEGLSGYFSFYYETRPHQGLAYETPEPFMQQRKSPYCILRNGFTCSDLGVHHIESITLEQETGK